MTTCDPSVSNPAYLILAWAGVSLQVAALAVAIALQGVGGASSLAIFLAVSLLCHLNSSSLPSLITLIVVAAAALNGMGWAFDFYDRFAAFDELIHAASAFAGMALIGYLAGSTSLLSALPLSLAFLALIAAAGLALGIAWEFVEMPFIDLTWTDTLVDLVMDTAGAAAGAVVAGWTLLRCARVRP